MALNKAKNKYLASRLAAVQPAKKDIQPLDLGRVLKRTLVLRLVEIAAHRLVRLLQQRGMLAAPSTGGASVALGRRRYLTGVGLAARPPRQRALELLF